MVLIISLALVALFVACGAMAPVRLAAMMQTALGATIVNFGWFYLLSMFGFLVFALYLAFGRFGTIRLGDEDAEPDFSRHSWFAMLFAAGMGIGLVFWGVAEPVSHFGMPPSGPAAVPEAARLGLRYAFFHWGLHPWAAYCVVALALAFFQFNRNRPMLMSTTFEPLLGKHAQGQLGKAIDILAVLATAIGVATSLGFGTLQISSGLHTVFGLPNGLSLQLTVIAVAAGLYLASSLSDLDRGVKILSNINMVLALLLMLFVLMVGPTLFILDSLTTTLGDYLDNLISMSMRMTPFSKGTWIADWTLFYWAWWVTWAPFVGTFIARISRGRTIREFVIGVLLVPSLISFLWFATFGGAALHGIMFEHLPLVDIVKQDSSLALFALLNSMPWSTLTSVLAIILVAVFFVTSADSATFVLGMMTSNGNPTPSARIKLAWGVLTALIAGVLLMAGGLKGLQTTSIVIALPFMIIMLAMCASLFRALSQEANTLERRRYARDRLLERLLRDHEENSA
ncbi:BCCT family transporter [Collimonas sp.]|jgi:glycine betaine transporter|uniref:glycine betaine uptake BCCT transporter n=1 Tax=Collimonas sp. TaxID=1963772 RepID=UPI0037BFAA93